MTSILEFRKESISQAEKDFSKLQLTPELKQAVAGSAQIYAQFIPMSQLAIKGFIAMTMRDFQVQEKLDTATIYKFPKEKRERYVQIMENMLQDKLEKVLRNPDQKMALREAIKKAHEYSAKMAAEYSGKMNG